MYVTQQRYYQQAILHSCSTFLLPDILESKQMKKDKWRGGTISILQKKNLMHRAVTVRKEEYIRFENCVSSF